LVALQALKLIENSRPKPGEADNQFDFRDKLRHKENIWQDDLKLGHLPIEEEVRLFEPIHAGYEKGIKLAHTLNKYPLGGAIYSYDPKKALEFTKHFQQLREIVGYLERDALLQAYLNRPEQSLASCLSMLQATHFAGEPTSLMEHLVNCSLLLVTERAIENWLSLTTPTQDLRGLQALLQKSLDQINVSAALRGERSRLSAFLQSLTDGQSIDTAGELFFQDNLFLPLMSKEERKCYYLKMLPKHHAEMLRRMSLLIEVAQTAEPERSQRLEKLIKSNRPILAELTGNAYLKMNESQNRTLARISATLIALECERYRQKFDRFPKSLSDLPKEFLEKVPIDPYTNKPLLFKKDDQGLLIYSTGKDGVDHGGAISPVGEPGKDLGFRLFDPKHRRKPAIPRPPEPKVNELD
jgi:hypothetical protein